MGFCDDSVLQGPVTCITMDRTTLISLASKSMSFHFSPNSSLILNPVPTSSSTRVRSLRASASNNCCTSLTLRTTGIFLRLALCLTNRMGLRE